LDFHLKAGYGLSHLLFSVDQMQEPGKAVTPASSGPIQSFFEVTSGNSSALDGFNQIQAAAFPPDSLALQQLLKAISEGGSKFFNLKRDFIDGAPAASSGTSGPAVVAPGADAALLSLKPDKSIFDLVVQASIICESPVSPGGAGAGAGAGAGSTVDDTAAVKAAIEACKKALDEWHRPTPVATMTPQTLKTPAEVWAAIQASTAMREWKPTADGSQNTVTWQKDACPELTVKMAPNGILSLAGGASTGNEKREFFQDYFLIMLQTLQKAGGQHELKENIKELIQKMADYYGTTVSEVKIGLALAFQEFIKSGDHPRGVLASSTYDALNAEVEDIRKQHQAHQSRMMQPGGQVPGSLGGHGGAAPGP
jgi:hypothetical protein